MFFFLVRHVPMSGGKVTQAGPGLLYSAAMGPLLFVGVHGLCVNPPISSKVSSFLNFPKKFYTKKKENKIYAYVHKCVKY